jgi:predicted site-specific integrase-resolvase
VTEDRYDMPAIARVLGVEKVTVRSWLHRGKLPPPSGRVGQSPWWAPEVIEPWINRERAVRAEQEQGA